MPESARYMPPPNKEWPEGTTDETIQTPAGERRVVEFPEPTNLKEYARNRNRAAKKKAGNAFSAEASAPSFKSPETRREKTNIYDCKIPPTINTRQHRINRGRRQERKFKLIKRDPQDNRE